MKDTLDNISDKHLQMLMSATREQRLIMGCSMFSLARQLVESSIKSSFKHISSANLKKEILFRFYKNDFPQEELNKIAINLS